MKTLLETLQDDDRAAAVTIGAAIALHGLLSSGDPPTVESVSRAFDIAEAFVDEAERRYGK